jgi:hypothetical protein
VAYTFAGVFAGGIAPLMFTRLYQAWQHPGPIVIYGFAALLITVAALVAARNVRASAPGVDPM